MTPQKFGHLRNWDGNRQMTPAAHEFKVGATTWSAIEAAVDDFAARVALSNSLMRKLVVCLDELYTNSFKYAAADQVTLTLSLADGVLRADYGDTGAAFDPVSWCRANTAPPDTPPDRVGGAGLHLVMGLSETASYQRSGGQNRLALTFVDDAAPPPHSANQM